MGVVNRGYNEKVFTISKSISEFAHLPNVGRFCLCGCNRRIEGKKITKLLKKGQVTTLLEQGRKIKLKKDTLINTRLKPRKDQVFLNSTCRRKYYNKTNGIKPNRTSLHALIKLDVIETGAKAYREIYIYLIPEVKEILKITPIEKDLWNFLNKVERNRKFKK